MMEKFVKIREENLELIEFYSKQRDSQLKQLMEINGKATFSATAAIVALFLGALSLESSEYNFLVNPYPIFLIMIGMVALFIASFLYSRSYNKRIKFFLLNDRFL